MIIPRPRGSLLVSRACLCFCSIEEEAPRSFFCACTLYRRSTLSRGRRFRISSILSASYRMMRTTRRLCRISTCFVFQRYPSVSALLWIWRRRPTAKMGSLRPALFTPGSIPKSRRAATKWATLLIRERAAAEGVSLGECLAAEARKKRLEKASKNLELKSSQRSTWRTSV